jgi:hypothetical protein
LGCQAYYLYEQEVYYLYEQEVYYLYEQELMIMCVAIGSH